MGIIIPALQVGKSRHGEIECLLVALSPVNGGAGIYSNPCLCESKGSALIGNNVPSIFLESSRETMSS